MEFYLQFGYGMMGHSDHLIDRWGGGAVILSPRDLEPDQLVRIAARIHDAGGSVLLDPQFYLPDATHERLQNHGYWPNQYESDEFWDEGGNSARLMADLHGLNLTLESDAIILPAQHAEALNEAWYERQEQVHALASELYGEEEVVFATVSLAPEVVRDRQNVVGLLAESDSWDVDGIYLVPEHPPSQYLISSPIWLNNVLDLVAGWRLDGAQVIIGYCNQQMLISACASPTAIASGNWRNVRSFPPDKFYTRDEIRRHSTWYYVPQALSEYQLDFLDIAHAQGVLEEMQAPDEYESNYASTLFAGPQPSTVEFSNSPHAFRHYLHCLKRQVESVRRDTYQETLDGVEDLVDHAFNLTNQWRQQGVFGAYREFGEEERDASDSALTLFDQNRGPMMRRRWQELE